MIMLVNIITTKRRHSYMIFKWRAWHLGAVSAARAVYGNPSSIPTRCPALSQSTPKNPRRIRRPLAAEACAANRGRDLE